MMTSATTMKLKTNETSQRELDSLNQITANKICAINVIGGH